MASIDSKFIPHNNEIYGRAATGLAALFSLFPENSKVLYPANICYAAIFPALYNRCIPVFCDVDVRSGNVTLETVGRSLETGIVAAVLPHMYGNPIVGFQAIKELLNASNIIVVEDCASALGAVDDTGSYVGFSGDYSLFSFGYSKTVSVGYGGLLCANGCSRLPFHTENLPLFSDEIESKEEFFSKVYRVFRNSGYGYDEFSSELFISLSSLFKDCFCFDLDCDQSSELIDKVGNAEEVIGLRRRQHRFYSEYFSEHFGWIEQYEMPEGASPWRFSFFVPSVDRSKVIKHLLDAEVPISDWYPTINACFNDQAVYPGASDFGSSVLNLPLCIDDFRLRDILRKIDIVFSSIISD